MVERVKAGSSSLFPGDLLADLEPQANGLETSLIVECKKA
jgi:hypothetical protein